MLSPLSRRHFSLVVLRFFLFWGTSIRGFWLKPGKNPPDHALKRHGLRRVSSVKCVKVNALIGFTRTKLAFNKNTIKERYQLMSFNSPTLYLCAAVCQECQLNATLSKCVQRVNSTRKRLYHFPALNCISQSHIMC